MWEPETPLLAFLILSGQLFPASSASLTTTAASGSQRGQDRQVASGGGGGRAAPNETVTAVRPSLLALPIMSQLYKRVYVFQNDRTKTVTVKTHTGCDKIRCHTHIHKKKSQRVDFYGAFWVICIDGAEYGP